MLSTKHYCLFFVFIYSHDILTSVLYSIFEDCFRYGKGRKSPGWQRLSHIPLSILSVHCLHLRILIVMWSKRRTSYLFHTGSSSAPRACLQLSLYLFLLLFQCVCLSYFPLTSSHRRAFARKFTILPISLTRVLPYRDQTFTCCSNLISFHNF